MRSLFNNFLRGLLFVFPIGATIYIIFASVRWSNDLLNNLLYDWLKIDIPGLGIITVFFGVALIGFLFTRTFTRPIVAYFERLLGGVPIVKIIYSSLKELTEAFVGDKKRFNNPVMVSLSDSETRRLGFLTQKNLPGLSDENLVAVYCPHSYNFSGNLFLVPADNVEPLDLNSTELMKFVVSGGVTQISGKIKSSG